LVNCCTIDWFQAWPADALEAVALKQLKEMDIDSVARKKLVAMCQSMHMQVMMQPVELELMQGQHMSSQWNSLSVTVKYSEG
jgi:dynein heavy chain